MQVKALFKDVHIFSESYIPKTLPGRESEIEQLERALYLAARGEAPDHVAIYGLAGTGKTIVTKYVLQKIENPKLYKMYINCAKLQTQSQILNSMIDELASTHIPLQGWGINKYYDTLYEMLEKKKSVLLLVLDEADKMKSRDILYTLTRADLKNSAITLIAITNSSKFFEELDERIQSSFGLRSLIFPSYNAGQLQKILRLRAEVGIHKGVLDDEVIPLTAALAARYYGDARKAIDILRTTVEIAEWEKAEKITSQYVRRAHTELERNIIRSLVRTAPLEKRLVLLAITTNEMANIKNTTGGIYDTYKRIAKATRSQILGARWASEVLSEFDMIGIIEANIISHGRGLGRTKVVKLLVSEKELLKTLKEDEAIAEINVVGGKSPSKRVGMKACCVA